MWGCVVTPRATPDDLDDVTQDAIKNKAPIPPMDLPQDQRRAFLGGVFSFRGGTTETPYTDPGCADAWRQGWEREKREAIRRV